MVETWSTPDRPRTNLTNSSWTGIGLEMTATAQQTKPKSEAVSVCVVIINNMMLNIIHSILFIHEQ